jgi:hypothetical protein
MTKAAEMTRQGVPQKEIGETLSISTRTIQRWAHENPNLFAPPPAQGSDEHLRQTHLDALEAVTSDGRPDHATRQRAAAELRKLGPQSKPSQHGPAVVYVGDVGKLGEDWPVDRCPHCRALLTSYPEGHERGDSNPTARAPTAGHEHAHDVVVQEGDET